MTLKLEQISQMVGGQMNLYPLNLTLVPNAVTVLLGATQAGKTSLMRLMAGLDTPTEGRVWVDGKTGGRWLIAKHRAVEVLKRLHARQRDICELSFETTFAQRVPHKLFRFSDGYQPPSLNGTFRRLMRDSGLEKNQQGQTRTLYSLRHTYATFELLNNKMDIHTLSKQMGNSAAMIERHYSKLTATMAAEKLA